MDLNNLMTDKRIIRHLNTYFNFINGERVKIKDKNGHTRILKMKVSVIYMPSVRKFMRFMEYEVTSTEDDFESSEEDVDADENQKKITRFNKNKNRKFDYSLFDTSEGKLKMLLDNLEQSTLMKAHETLNLASSDGPKGNTSHNWNNGFTTLHDGMRALNEGVAVFQEPLEQTSKGKKSRAVEEVYPSRFRIKAKQFLNKLKKKILERKLTAKPKEPESTGHAGRDKEEKSKSKAHGREIQRKQKSEGHSKAASSIFKGATRADEKEQGYIEVIRFKIETLNQNVMFILLLLTVLGATIAQLAFGYVKYIDINKMNKDIELRVVSVDLSAWAVFCAVTTLSYMDTASAIRKSIISNSNFSHFGIPDILAHNHQSKEWMLSGFLRYYTALDLKVVNFSYPQLFDKSFKMNEVNGTGFPLLFEAGATQQPVDLWGREQWKIKKLLAYSQPYADKYILRDDSLASSESDAITEETVRKNVGGDMLGHLLKTSSEVSKYFVLVCERSRDNVYNSEMVAIGCLVGLAFIVVAFSLFLKQKMRSIYELLFDLKVSSSEPARRREARSEALGEGEGVHEGAGGR
jgi:hypothetical protein